MDSYSSDEEIEAIYTFWSKIPINGLYKRTSTNKIQCLLCPKVLSKSLFLLKMNCLVIRDIIVCKHYRVPRNLNK